MRVRSLLFIGGAALLLSLHGAEAAGHGITKRHVGSNPRAHAAIVSAVDIATRPMRALRSVSCKRADEGALVAYECTQRVRGGPRHFAVLSIEARRAAGVGKTGAVLAGASAMGPGGASASWSGRTRDGRYDVIANEAALLGRGDDAALPVARLLVETTLRAYDRKSLREQRR